MTTKDSRLMAGLTAEMQTFEKLEPVIHEKVRLAIVSVLAANRPLRFVELRDGLGLTDGNLAAHLKALDAAGFVKIHKVGKARNSITTVALTLAGRKSFTRYVEALERIVKRHR
jgi:DNA-binding MarR family transcriptional regulator